MTPDAKEWMKKFARGNEISVRIQAVEMLGYIGDPATLSDLAENLGPYPEEWPGHLAEALGRMGGPRALRVLTTLVNDRYLLQGYKWESFRQIGEAVGRIDRKDRTTATRRAASTPRGRARTRCSSPWPGTATTRPSGRWST